VMIEWGPLVNTEALAGTGGRGGAGRGGTRYTSRRAVGGGGGGGARGGGGGGGPDTRVSAREFRDRSTLMQKLLSAVAQL
jgi:hypothetical protein